ncbi:calcium-activated chloride channel regulator 4-like [Watersipora subatra]|uniref:calcium-activated chloride channel regulator 4-like n=1 Tax=Watersipora subatra TaxID=2589382 RepID=UPI00355B67BE
MDTNDRITTMSEAVQLYIMSYLRDGTAVGIVSFSDFAFLHADMTEVTSDEVKESLRASVPTQTIGGTNIAAGIYECQRILTQYTGGDIRNARILLHSDGEGRVDDSIEQIISEGVILDTVLFGQGGYLADQAEQTGGQQYFASDERGGVGLLAFYESTALRTCEAESEDALLNNDLILIVTGKLTYQGRVYFDVTIGMNTKMVFQYDARVEISISTNYQLTISEDANSLTTIVTIEGRLVKFLDYTITKEDPDTEVSVILTVTSSPVPGIQPIVVNNRLNSKNIDFSASSELIGYMGVFQGYSSVLQLAVFTVLEDPSGSLTRIQYFDDGTGKDSVANDGIYTGFLPPHLIGGGSSGKFYGLSIDIQGEGLLPGPGVVGRRKKRCVGCNSLGNVTRSGSGGVIVIDNWVQLNDATPPEKITDLMVLAVSEDNDRVILAWTAPGEDLNMGRVSGYDFGVGAEISIDAMINLAPALILSNVSTFLVEAGSLLEMQVNTGAITPAMLGLPESANISTYYFRVRTYDSSNNYANWSNPVSASYVDPAVIAVLYGPTTSTTNQPTETTTKAPSLTYILIGVGGGVFLVIAIGLAACLSRCKSKSKLQARHSHQQASSEVTFQGPAFSNGQYYSTPQEPFSFQHDHSHGNHQVFHNAAFY